MLRYRDYYIYYYYRYFLRLVPFRDESDASRAWRNIQSATGRDRIYHKDVGDVVHHTCRYLSKSSYRSAKLGMQFGAIPSTGDGISFMLLVYIPGLDMCAYKDTNGPTVCAAALLRGNGMHGWCISVASRWVIENRYCTLSLSLWYCGSAVEYNCQKIVPKHRLDTTRCGMRETRCSGFPCRGIHEWPHPNHAPLTK